MIIIGEDKKKLDENEQRQRDANQIGFLAFVQTLPQDAVITDEGVYASRSEQFLMQRQRQQELEASGDGTDSGDTNRRSNR